jgi:hypothetical protein
MPATPIAPVTRYQPKGNLKWVYCPSVANKAAPTRAEINAGTDISKQVADYSGWTTTSQFIDTPDVNSRFTAKIPGAIEAEDSSLTVYLDPSGSDVRTLLPRDATGCILRMDSGDIPGRKMDVFPIQVGSVGKPFEMDAAVVAEIQFAITDEPAENVTIPA